MKLLHRLFEARPARNRRDVVLWWELRRIPYNLILLMIGVVSILVFELLIGVLIAPGEDAEEPLGMLLGIAAYAFAANVCYTSGWVSEFILLDKDPASAARFRTKAFKAGLAFSCLLTSLPIWLAFLVFVVVQIKRHI